MCFIKNKDLQDYHRSLSLLHFYILPFLLRKFFKTGGEILHLLTLPTKLIFRGALKKAFMVPEDRCNQKQHFAKIFPSLLASTLHIHFYFHLKNSSENALWIAIALKSATFGAPESASETALETTYFMLFLKKLTKNLEKKVMNCVCFDRLDQFYTHFLFPACYFFCY